MAPILATEPKITRTPEPDVAAADLALLDDVRPASYCRRCGIRADAEYHGDCADFAEPVTPERWLRIATGGAIREILGGAWLEHPFRHELLALVGDRLAGRDD